ncbi:MAG: hypothetical protein H5U40_04725, partial [Polyangiaceae bacterium]|nr:hypothetical protein [Polyangiaceae bacterium]
MTSASWGTRGAAEHRAGLARIAALAALFLACFGALDALLVVTIHPEVGLGVPFALRALVVAIALGGWWVASEPRFGDRAAEASHRLLLASSAALMAVLSSMLAGPGGPYVHGLSI